MENAVLYAFAHVINQMGQIDGEFDKGDADGTTDALKVIVTTARRLRCNDRTFPADTASPERD